MIKINFGQRGGVGGGGGWGVVLRIWTPDQGDAPGPHWGACGPQTPGLLRAPGIFGGWAKAPSPKIPGKSLH